MTRSLWPLRQILPKKSKWQNPNVKQIPNAEVETPQPNTIVVQPFKVVPLLPCTRLKPRTTFGFFVVVQPFRVVTRCAIAGWHEAKRRG